MLFRKRNGCGFYLIWMLAVSFSVACDHELNDNGCHQMTISVSEGKSVQVPLSSSGIIRDLCIWNNSTSRWENACHFSHGVCRTLLTHFKEDVSTKGNKFELKNVSNKASGIYKLLDKPGNCVLSMRVSVLNATSSRSGTFNMRLEKWSGVMWVCFLVFIPKLAIL